MLALDQQPATHKDNMMTNKIELELELEQDLIDYLTTRAIIEDTTIDQIVEDILTKFIDEFKE
jgi:hypothetical protein